MTDKVPDDRSLDWLFFTLEPEPKFELEFSRLVTGPRRKTSFHHSSLLTCRLGLVTEVGDSDFSDVGRLFTFF